MFDTDEGWTDLSLTIHPEMAKMPFLPCPEIERVHLVISVTPILARKCGKSISVAIQLSRYADALLSSRAMRQKRAAPEP